MIASSWMMTVCSLVASGVENSQESTFESPRDGDVEIVLRGDGQLVMTSSGLKEADILEFSGEVEVRSDNWVASAHQIRYERSTQRLILRSDDRVLLRFYPNANGQASWSLSAKHVRIDLRRQAIECEDAHGF